MMPLLILVVLAVVAFMILTVIKKKQEGTGSIDLPYQPAKALFSPAEQNFLKVLDQAVGTEYRVFGKVRVADIASVKPGLGNSARQGALNKIASKHFDFIVCRANDLVPVCAVELNDKSHSTQRAQKRDDFIVELCQKIKLPLLNINAKNNYSLDELQEQFRVVTNLGASKFE